ncbi:Checkpoint protein hus1, partial [Coemansia sp. RSA 2708]
AEGGLQMWSDVLAIALFSDYRLESLHNNEIHLEVHIDNLQRALRSAQGAQRATLKLTKKQGLPVLSFIIKNLSSTGRELTLCQDVPVRVLSPDQAQAIVEPAVARSPLHIVMPPLGSVRSVAERMRALGDRVSVAANQEGQLTLRVANEGVDITAYFRGLQNLVHATPEADAAPARPAHEPYTATVDTRNFMRFLQSYHVAPKNIICCIVEHQALILYVNVGSAATFGPGADDPNDPTRCGTLTYFLPVRQV